MQSLAPTLTREALATMIRAHPDTTLAQLAELGPTLLERVRVGDLFAAGLSAGEIKRLRHAEQLRGREFDACVAEVVAAAGRAVASGYVRARVGGPRWKVQKSLGRLVDAGRLARTGTTSTTLYRINHE